MSLIFSHVIGIRRFHWLMNVKLKCMFVPLCPIQRFDLYADLCHQMDSRLQVTNDDGWCNSLLLEQNRSTYFHVIQHSCKLHENTLSMSTEQNLTVDHEHMLL